MHSIRAGPTYTAATDLSPNLQERLSSGRNGPPTTLTVMLPAVVADDGTALATSTCGRYSNLPLRMSNSAPRRVWGFSLAITDT